MVANSLKDRMLNYEAVSDYKLTCKLPVIITLNGRSFRKITSLLDKPYSEIFVEIMGQTLIRLASEIEGAVFLYSFNDQIVIICRNDQQLQTEAWYNNYIQDIISSCASIASISFFTAAQKKGIKLLGEPIFIGNTFVVPNITEAINYLIYAQHQASQTAIDMATFYELLRIHPTEKVLQMTKHLTIDEKYNLLMKTGDVDLQSWPLAFWRGFACYRTSQLTKTNFGEEIKYKLTINDQLPFFDKDKEFLCNILKSHKYA